jgi:hypothetical protein
MLAAYKKFAGVEKADEGSAPPAFQTAWRKQRLKWSSDVWLKASNEDGGQSHGSPETQIPAQGQGFGGD